MPRLSQIIFQSWLVFPPFHENSIIGASFRYFSVDFEHSFAIPIEISHLIHWIYDGLGMNEWIYEIPERFHWSIQSNLVAGK